jgi:hypothetical protein
MNNLLNLIIYLLLGGVIIYLVYWILGMVAIDPRLRQVISVVVAVIVIIWLLVTFVPGLSLG